MVAFPRWTQEFQGEGEEERQARLRRVQAKFGQVMAEIADWQTTLHFAVQRIRTLERRKYLLGIVIQQIESNG